LPDAPLVGEEWGIYWVNLARPGREQPKLGRSALADSGKEETPVKLYSSSLRIKGATAATSLFRESCKLKDANPMVKGIAYRE